MFSNGQSVVEVTQSDFDVAIKQVVPTAKREGFAVIPDGSYS